MKSIRWKLVFMYLTLVFIVMLITGTFIIMRIESQETKKAEDELRSCAVYIEEQIVSQAANEEELQKGFVDLFLKSAAMRNIQGNIINAQGETIASTVSTDQNYFQEYKNSVVISALAGKESFSANKKDIDLNSQVKEFMSYGCPVYDDGGDVKYVIYVQMDSKSISDSLSQTIKTIVTAVFLALALTAILGLLFANTITSPISLLTKKANLLAKGHLEQHIIVKSNDEIGQLTRSFNYMARELRKTVSDMENENNKLEILLHNMTDGVLAFDEMGNLIHANKVSCDLLDVDEKRITFEWFLNKMEITREDLKPDIIKEVNIVSRDKYLSASLIPYTGKNRRIEGIVAVIQDITKHKRLDELRKEFVANVSHEIRTPITNIKSYTETLLEGAIDDKDIALDFLNEINSAADRMTYLTNDLLELSRLDGNKINFKFAKAQLFDIVSSSVKQNAISASKKNQEIILVQPKENNMSVYVDEGRITQVINNIISNAMKYSPEKTKILVELGEEDNQYFVKITDSGIGIPKEDLERIFERFYRVDKARSRAMGGNGLGLSIAMEMMQGHGGTIKASSSTGRGTTMRVYIPKYRDFYKKVNGNSL